MRMKGWDLCMPTNTTTEAPPLPGQRGHKDKLKTLPQDSRKRQGRARDRLRKEKKEEKGEERASGMEWDRYT